ncbi:hypothetical protein J6590_104434, partial [Homalodisca vitripennis]
QSIQMAVKTSHVDQQPCPQKTTQNTNNKTPKTTQHKQKPHTQPPQKTTQNTNNSVNILKFNHSNLSNEATSHVTSNLLQFSIVV